MKTKKIQQPEQTPLEKQATQDLQTVIDTPQPETVVTTESNEKAFKAAEMSVNNVESLAAKLSDFKEAPSVPGIDEAKRKRGRPSGSTKNTPKIPVEDFKPKVEQPVFAGAVISGLVLLTIVDAFIPWIIVSIHNKYRPHKIKIQDLQLDAAVKKELGTVADEAMKAANFKISPTQALFFSLIAAYGTAYMSASTKAIKPK